VIAITHLCDLLGRLRGLGYGYEEWRAIDLTADPARMVLGNHCHRLATIDPSRLTLDLDTYLAKGTALVNTIFPRRSSRTRIGPPRKILI
jgi:hypothetical protein